MQLNNVSSVPIILFTIQVVPAFSFNVLLDRHLSSSVQVLMAKHLIQQSPAAILETQSAFARNTIMFCIAQFEKRAHQTNSVIFIVAILNAMIYFQRAALFHSNALSTLEDVTDIVIIIYLNYILSLYRLLGDCADGEDETNCPSCARDQFACVKSGTCIPAKLRCDGHPDDCADGSNLDEIGCSKNESELNYQLTNL